MNAPAPDKAMPFPDKLEIMDASEKHYKSFSYVVYHGEKPNEENWQYGEQVVMQNHPYYNTAPDKELAAEMVRRYNLTAPSPVEVTFEQWRKSLEEWNRASDDDFPMIEDWIAFKYPHGLIIKRT